MVILYGRYWDIIKIFFFIFFWLFCVVIRFFYPTTTANDLRLQRISIPDRILVHYFLILILEKEPVFPFRMFSAKQGHYWYHFISSLVWRGHYWGLNPGPPALDASTVPLGYRGGGPWLGIEPGTSRTRSHHFTTRLSRRHSLWILWLYRVQEGNTLRNIM